MSDDSVEVLANDCKATQPTNTTNRRYTTPQFRDCGGADAQRIRLRPFGVAGDRDRDNKRENRNYDVSGSAMKHCDCDRAN
jgi:hypothetical protein